MVQENIIQYWKSLLDFCCFSEKYFEESSREVWMPINRDQQISKSANPNKHKIFLSFQILQTISWTLGSPRLGFSPLLCPLYSLSKFSCFFSHKLMFLLITFLFISLFNLNRFKRNTNKMSNKTLLNLLLPENQLVNFIQKKVFPHWSQKKKNTSLFIITFHCFTIRESNRLAFRVRRAATCPFTSMDQHYHLQ